MSEPRASTKSLQEGLKKATKTLERFRLETASPKLFVHPEHLKRYPGLKNRDDVVETERIPDDRFFDGYLAGILTALAIGAAVVGVILVRHYGG